MHFALHRRGFVIAGTLVLMAAGLFALQRIPFDAFPDLTGTRVEVITVAPGMAPEEVERLVTHPVESALMGVPGAEGVRSVVQVRPLAHHGAVLRRYGRVLRAAARAAAPG